MSTIRKQCHPAICVCVLWGREWPGLQLVAFKKTQFNRLDKDDFKGHPSSSLECTNAKKKKKRKLYTSLTLNCQVTLTGPTHTDDMAHVSPLFYGKGFSYFFKLLTLLAQLTRGKDYALHYRLFLIFVSEPVNYSAKCFQFTNFANPKELP